MAKSASRIYVSPAQKLAKIDVLILDNDTKIIELMTNVMRTLGFESLHRAQDGFEGVSILRKQSVDLIITDWDLQPMKSQVPEDASGVVTTATDLLPNNGASFVRSLRHSKHSPNPFVPVIMLTGPTLPDNIRYARDAGVNEILMKPIVAEDLCGRIIEIIDNPRTFVTCAAYKGPCRRRRHVVLDGQPERRKMNIQIIKSEKRSY